MKAPVQLASIALSTVLLCTPVCGAQEPNVIPLKQEPHHHLKLHNEYVNVYAVEVAPHDQVILHRHDADAISIMLGDASITVRSPGKPDVQQKMTGGQVRLQRNGYVHSTSIDGDTTYRNVTVELLLPQQGARNLCAAVMAGEPLSCQNESNDSAATGGVIEPRFKTDETTVSMIRILPHRTFAVNSNGERELVVALDDIATNAEKNGSGHLTHSADFLWRETGAAPEIFKNDSDKEARLVTFVFKAENTAK